MLNFKNKQKDTTVYAPADGIAVKLSEVPDEAFSEKILGDGCAVVLTSGEIYSPVNGKISDITDTKHAFCITTDGGDELLIHIGIDTVKLKGKGFNVNVVPGEKVKVGTIIANIDLDYLKESGISLHTPVILTEAQNYDITQLKEGKVDGGKDILFMYKKNS